MPSPDSDLEGVPYEKLIEELEAISRRLEAGNLPLSESVALYERGVAIVKACHKLLDEYEGKIVKVVRLEDGSFEEAPFDEGAE